jgi:hypothetical protein
VVALRRQRRPAPDPDEEIILERPSYTPAPGFWSRSLLTLLALVVGFIVFRGPVLSRTGDLLDKMVASEKFPEIDRAAVDLEFLVVDDAPLENGSRGDAVSDLQKGLNFLGYDTGLPDGVYGTRTSEAIRQYQLARNLNPDGVANERTIAVLLEELGRQVVSAEGPEGPNEPEIGDFSDTDVSDDFIVPAEETTDPDAEFGRLENTGDEFDLGGVEDDTDGDGEVER